MLTTRRSHKSCKTNKEFNTASRSKKAKRLKTNNFKTNRLKTNLLKATIIFQMTMISSRKLKITKVFKITKSRSSNSPRKNREEVVEVSPYQLTTMKMRIKRELRIITIEKKE